METGFFTMDLVNEAYATRDLEAAKKIALEAISSQSKKAKPANVEKANTMVRQARTLDKLIFGMTGFVLAHPSEGLKVI